MPDVNATLQTALATLKADRDELDRKITALTKIMDGTSPGRRRGRPKMSAAERKKVGQRMKAYWANRKAKKKPVVKATVKKLTKPKPASEG